MSLGNIKNRITINVLKPLVLIALTAFFIFFYYYLYKLLIIFQVNHSELFITTDEYLFSLFIATIVAVALPLFKARLIFIWHWLFKLSIIFFIALFFENNYDFIDSFLYFETAVNYPSHSFVLMNATHNVSTVLSYLFDFIPSSYRAGSVFFSLIGMLGLYLFWRASRIFSDKISTSLLVLLLFFPSLAFWSSFIGKEAITLFFIGMYILGIALAYKRGRIISSLALIVSACIGFLYFRFWLIPIFTSACILTFLFFKDIQPRKKIVFLSILTILCIGGTMASMNFFHITTIADILNLIIAYYQDWAHGGSAQYITIDSWISLISSVPLFMLTALFRPLIFEKGSLFFMLAGIENTLLLMSFIVAIGFIVKKRLWNDFVVQFSFFHILIFSIVYGPISYSNLGTAERFKMQILPFLLLFVYYSIVYKYNNVMSKVHVNKLSRQGVFREENLSYE